MAGRRASPTSCACRRRSSPTPPSRRWPSQALGYEAVHHGEGRWNGVAILSRVGLDDVVAGFGDGEAGGCRGAARHRDLRRRPRDERLRAERAGARPRALPVQAAVAGAAARPPRRRRRPGRRRSSLCGDFNIAPDRPRRVGPGRVVDTTHVSAPERDALAELLDWGLVDVFRASYPDADRLFSWWDYRAGNFHKGTGMRIDLVLGQPAARRAGRVGAHRPQRPQGQAALRPRPAHGGLRWPWLTSRSTPRLRSDGRSSSGGSRHGAPRSARAVPSCTASRARCGSRSTRSCDTQAEEAAITAAAELAEALAAVLQAHPEDARTRASPRSRTRATRSASSTHARARSRQPARSAVT